MLQSSAHLTVLNLSPHHPMEEDHVKDRIIDRLSSDLLSCDCHVTLFISALTSYRHDTVLKPFPSQYVLEDGTKDIEHLRAVLNDLPVLDKLFSSDGIDEELIELLDWILIRNNNFSLHSKPLSTFSIIEKATLGSTHTVKPHVIFELEYNTDQETRWLEVVKDHGTFLAYHGTRVENIYCISHIGLISHMNKIGMYGEGTYLSTDLAVCMNFSPSAKVWKNSMLPSLCSMVTVCEVVNSPEIRSRVQVGGEPSLNQKIPERYFVVTNNEQVRLKYILVFAQQAISRPSATSNWISKHKWLLMIVLYITFLMLIGLYNSKYFSTLYRHYTRKHITL